MITILSPAKTLDFESDPFTDHATDPEFAAEAAKLVGVLRKMTRPELASFMGVSEDLADLNHRRFKDWRRSPRPERARQAILAFRGDVYRGFGAESLDEADLAFAQDHLRILSGLYGILRPLDRIQPYRLEMGSALPTDRGRTLYEFWGDRLADAIRRDLEAAGDGDPVLVNLASNEYAKAVRPRKLGVRVVTPVFKETKDRKHRTIALFSKEARGMMASFIVRNRIDRVEDLQHFGGGGYAYRPRFSDEDTIVFTRPQPAPAAAR